MYPFISLSSLSLLLFPFLQRYNIYLYFKTVELLFFHKIPKVGQFPGVMAPSSHAITAVQGRGVGWGWAMCPRGSSGCGRWAGRRTHPYVREDVCDSRQGSGLEVWNMLPQGISFSV